MSKKEIIVPKRESRKSKKLVYTYKKGKKVIVDKKEVTPLSGPKAGTEGPKKQ